MPTIEDREITLTVLREKRHTAESIYIKFIESKQYFGTHAFCFFEGEDGKYYNARIAQYFEENFIPFSVGNKSEVLKLMKKLQSDEQYSRVCLMFFIDRDFDLPLAGTNSDLFETPCYSIENFYTQEVSLCSILKAEFGLNVTDSDYDKCIALYRRCLTDFCSYIIHFNALVVYQHRYCDHTICNFSSVKTSQLVQLRDYEVVKASRHDEQMEKLMTALNPDKSIIERIEEELSAVDEPNLMFRGKNQLDFFVCLIKFFKDQNSKGGYFSRKLDAVHINLSENRLSELSQYAITPPELINFISTHYEQLCSISQAMV